MISPLEQKADDKYIDKLCAKLSEEIAFYYRSFMKACLGNPYSPNVMYFKQGVYNLEILKQVKKVLKKELGGFLEFGAPPVRNYGYASQRYKDRT